MTTKERLATFPMLQGGRWVGVPLLPFNEEGYAQGNYLRMVSSLLYTLDVEEHRELMPGLDLLIGLHDAVDQGYAVTTSEGADFIEEMIKQVDEAVYHNLRYYGLVMEPGVKNEHDEVCWHIRGMTEGEWMHQSEFTTSIKEYDEVVAPFTRMLVKIGRERHAIDPLDLSKFQVTEERK